MNRKIAIIGGGAAGVLIAERLAALKETDIIILEESEGDAIQKQKQKMFAQMQEPKTYEITDPYKEIRNSCEPIKCGKERRRERRRNERKK